MIRIYFLVAAGFATGLALLAQTQPGAMPFQQIQQIQPAGRGGVNMMPLPRSEPGRPFSATVTSQTIQTYPDGMHVTQTTTMIEYRDAEGRTRTEVSQNGRGSSEPRKRISIHDPVAGVNYSLDPATRTALESKLAAPAGRGGGAARGARGTQQPDDLDTQARLDAVQRLRDEALHVIEEQTRSIEAQTGQRVADMVRNDSHNTVEDLGAMTINGISARGTRITTVVPIGAIGNDREFRSVSERWFSPDLNLFIKSVNTDPRFGTTTYELTNISRQPPDPSLVRVPADYETSPTKW